MLKLDTRRKAAYPVEHVSNELTLGLLATLIVELIPTGINSTKSATDKGRHCEQCKMKHATAKVIGMHDPSV